MAEVKRIVLVGHCGADSGMLGDAVDRAAGNVPVTSVNDQRSLEKHAGPDALLLVNRVLDGRFEAGDGIELIRRLRQRPDAPAAMLISNYEEAQREAVAAGALPGFGKSRAYDAGTAELLKRALGAAPESPRPPVPPASPPAGAPR